MALTGVQQRPWGRRAETMANYHIVSCHVLWREFCYFAALSPHTYNFTFLERGLHDTPDRLRQELQAAIDNVAADCEAVLLGYGLCCNGIAGIVARERKLVVVRAHDCITFLLGSKERYREYFDSHPGTYWYSPGWIETNSQPGQKRYEQTLREYTEKYGEDNAQYLMEMQQGWLKEYANAAYVDLGFGDTSGYKEYTRKCARWLNWNYDELKGDARLIVDLLAGDWDEERFLVVDPGARIAATHDERIVRAEGHKGT